jgi:hypothetical protein
MDPEFNVTASDWRRAVVGIAVALASMTTTAAGPTGAAERAGDAAVCKARGSPARLEVRCPATTVAEFLAALRQATGLRSEYPPEFARARVSITLRRASLSEVLEHALSGFNFAVWTDDQRSPSVTWLKIVDERRTVEHAERPPAHQEAVPSADVVTPSATAPYASEVAPTSATLPPPSEMAPASAAVPRSSAVAPSSAGVPRSMANLNPPSNEAEMAVALENFARSVTPATALEAPPLDPGSGMPLPSTLPVIMPGVEMPR